MNLKDTYNLIAEEWHEDHQSDDWWVEGTDEFCKRVPVGGSVLDIGCGGGAKSSYLANRGLTVTGIDFAEKLIAIARREVPQASFDVLDMRDIGTLTEMYDGLFAQASLLHIPKSDVQSLVQSWLTKLNSDGYLYIAVKAHQDGTPDEADVQYEKYGHSFTKFFSYFTLAELKDLFSSLGLSIVYENTSLWGHTEWVQVIGQKT